MKFQPMELYNQLIECYKSDIMIGMVLFESDEKECSHNEPSQRDRQLDPDQNRKSDVLQGLKNRHIAQTPSSTFSGSFLSPFSSFCDTLELFPHDSAAQISSKTQRKQTPTPRRSAQIFETGEKISNGLAIVQDRKRGCQGEMTSFTPILSKKQKIQDMDEKHWSTDLHQLIQLNSQSLQ